MEVYKSSYDGMRTIGGRNEASIRANDSSARLRIDTSTLTKKCVGCVDWTRCAIAAGEFLGDMGRKGIPARSMPTHVVKYVIVSDKG